MLHQVLEEVEKTRGPLSLQELSHRLGVEQSALEGMIGYWVRKGRLSDTVLANDACGASASSGCSCGSSAAEDCPFAGSMPRTITLTENGRT
jgi:hypothetical protein